MATQWIDIADTAVKIGLGALISGVATYAVSNLHHKKDIQKYLITKKMDMLDEITELTEVYFHHFIRLANRMNAMAHHASNAGSAMTKEQFTIVLEHERDFDEMLCAISKAMAKIRILSITSAADEISSFNDITAEYKKILYDQKILIPEDMGNKLLDKALGHKQKFYDCINRYLSSLA